MRLALDPRARRLLQRVPRTNVYSVLELLLLSLLAIQCARLVWTIVTPVGPVGDWKAPSELQPAGAGSIGLLAGFDPFFRLSTSGGRVVVTSLNLTLYGIRQDQASGRGSAIIATPDGEQRSYAVGEEIVPGVTLTAVDFDNVTISRGGVPEQLFMDQSPPAQTVGPPGSPPAVPPQIFPPSPVAVPVVVAPPPRNPAADINFQPRTAGTRVTGVVVAPQGSGDGFRAAGLAPGDVIVRVNGRQVDSLDRIRSIGADLGGARGAIVQVERDGRVITLRPGSSR